jgi:hypothetical protein
MGRDAAGAECRRLSQKGARAGEQAGEVVAADVEAVDKFRVAGRVSRGPLLNE